MFKKLGILAVLLITSLFLTNGASASEKSSDVQIINKDEEKAVVKNSDGDIITVNFDSSEIANQIDESIIIDLVGQSDNSDNLTIHSIETSQTSESSLITPLVVAGVVPGITIITDGDADPSGLIYSYKTTKTQFLYDAAQSAEQIASVPQGGTYRFSSNRTITNSASATGQLTAGANASWCIIKQYCNIHLSIRCNFNWSC